MSKKNKLLMVGYAIVDPRDSEFPNGKIYPDTIAFSEEIAWYRLTPNCWDHKYHDKLGLKAKKVKVILC